MNEILYEKDVEQNGTALLPNPVQGKIEFRDVSFSYEEGMDPVLNAISFRVAHRLETLRRADTVYRVDGGKLRRYDSFEQVIQDMKGEDGT